MEANNELERKTLRIVLFINVLMFFIEFIFGLIAQSTGVVADSLDMFADASVYAISLYVVGRSLLLQTKAAKLSGAIQILLAVFVLFEVIHRFVVGSEPISMMIIILGSLALMANTISLVLINKHRDAGVHMQASLIFSKNDVIANIGIILSGVLVWLLDSHYPDLIIGFIISIIVLRGGIQILRVAAKNQVVN